MRKIIFLLFVTFNFTPLNAQWYTLGLGKSKDPLPEMLLTNRAVQIESTNAVNNMYNFKFDEAAREFKWLKVKYPEHPLGDFLLGLNEWWKIIPDTKNEKFDDQCHQYMDAAIDKADDLLDDNSKNKEASFFLAAAYAVKGRLYSEREKWVKAAWAGKQSMKHLDNGRGEANINPELLFGDGVYNYYSKWIHENYKSLKPLLTFFKKGDKKLGIKQLENVANNAFYSRMEARYFLVQIYAMENQTGKSLQMARQMHALYPDNSFFHRYVARNSFSIGNIEEAQVYAKELLEKIKFNKYGYGDNDGRYGAYILGYCNENYAKDYVLARQYYLECVAFAMHNNSKESGYYLASNMALGRLAEKDNDYKSAVEYYAIVLKESEKKSDSYKEAKQHLEDITKMFKAKKKKK